MAVDTKRIKIGEGKVFVGGTPPATGSDPNDPTAGTPVTFNTMNAGFTAPTSGGTDVGFTQGAAVLTFRVTYYMVATEQSMAEVVTVPTAEEASLAFTMLELSYANLKTAFQQATSRVTNAGLSNQIAGVTVGGKTTLTPQVVVVASRHIGDVGYTIGTLYKAFSSDGSNLGFNRAEESRLPVTMRCLADATRSRSDQLFQVVDYDAGP